MNKMDLTKVKSDKLPLLLQDNDIISWINVDKLWFSFKDEKKMGK